MIPAAEALAGLRTGDIEGGFLGGPGIRLDARGPAARYTLLRALGYSLTDFAQIGVALGLAGDFRSAPSSEVVVEGRYYPPAAMSLLPYVGLHAGAIADLFQSDPRVSEVVGPQVGFKWEWSDRFLVVGELRYSLEARQPERGVLFLLIGVSTIAEREQAVQPATIQGQVPPPTR